jgi:hypothetical protein
MYTVVLIGCDPAPHPHLGSYTRALLVSKDLFVTPEKKWNKHCGIDKACVAPLL